MENKIYTEKTRKLRQNTQNTNSKLVEVVTVANVDDEGHIGNLLLQIWKLRIGHKA